MKNKTTAAIIAWLGGGFGLHRFYLGQIRLGIVYLIFFWTLIPGFIGLIDFFIFLTMNEDKFNSKYNQDKVAGASVGINTTVELEKLHGLKEKKQ
tara:strand:+ start:400 stop:684 length:285 start_codon:yes stop_codon:yes gene_type:complete